MIYEPSEDSFLLEKTLEEFLKNKKNNIKILDIGSGSGIQAKKAKELGFKNILVSDINKEAVAHLKKSGFKVAHSDLFLNIKKKFDLIIFNPPYLPENSREPADSKLATTGGKKGYEIILRFLEQSRDHLNKSGSVLLLFSSLSKPSIIKKNAKKLGFKLRLLNKQKLFFEELFVYELK